jgi:class 3 adenylate cyclase
VNVAARLGSLAGPGQLLVSSRSWDASPHSIDVADRRSVQVSGRSEPLDVVTVQVGALEAIAAT